MDHEPRAHDDPLDLPPTEALREGPGTRIGPYTLVEQIGEGGFGVVFRAEQQRPVARTVALKVIKLGMDTRQFVARFEQERQALALMDHPNIARVLDAGATDTGRPYFVMDLVHGAPITEYCDAHKISIAGRLELFAQVCSAVQHAHTKGIIHRDIKPSNILVGVQDERPQVKVIDFGIAKATSRKLGGNSILTEHEQVIGTLQYMSPEQAEGSLDIDTRTDVYSLGILLYELLTGSTPFDKKMIGDALFGEIRRMIREIEPPRPSTRLSDSHDAIANIAAQRRVEPRRLGSILRGDLDWIVMKALEKDRSRRYESASSLALDVRRHLDGESVLAAPPSAAYRLRKFVRRNRVSVFAVSAVAAALLAGIVAFAWQARVANAERDNAVKATELAVQATESAVKAAAAEADARKLAQELSHAEAEQRAIAERNENKAAAINKFLLDMLGSANTRKLGRDAKVAQALDRAAEKVDTAFAERPEVEAAVRGILGTTYLSIGELDKAEPQLAAARAMNRRIYGPESLEYSQSLQLLGSLKSERGAHTEAVESMREAIEIAAKSLDAESASFIGMRTDYANALVRVGRAPEAEVILRELLATRTRVFGRETNDSQILLNSLAVLLHNANRLDEAEELYREAVDVGVKVLGADHPDTLTARINLASLLRSRNKLSEAEELMVGAYADARRVFGDAHTRTASVAWVLGGLYQAQGRHKDALPMFEDCVAIRIRAEGEQTEGVATAKSSLAITLKSLGEPVRAAAVQREVVDVQTALHGAESEDALGARLDLANSLAALDGASDVEAVFRELLQVAPRALGEEHRITVITRNSFALFLADRDRCAEALPLVEKALAAGRRTEGSDAQNTIITQLNLARIQRDLGLLTEAEATGRDALERFLRVLGPKHPNTAFARGGLARTFVRLGRNDEAERELLACIALSKASLGATNPGFCGDALELGRMYIDTGRAEKAEPVLREVVDVFTRVRGSQDRRTAIAQLELARCRQEQRGFAEAEALLVASHATLTKVRAPGHKDIRKAERYLSALYAGWNTAEPDAERASKAAQWRERVDAAPSATPAEHTTDRK